MPKRRNETEVSCSTSQVRGRLTGTGDRPQALRKRKENEQEKKK